MHPLVKVVVLNYNGGELLRQCLARLDALDWPRERLEIVVVDNASTDGSARAAEERGDALLLRSPENRGFGAGNNLALDDPGGAEYVALLNNDALVEPGWLTPLVETLEGDPGLGAACPKILFEPRFGEVSIEAPAYRPGGVDPRELGVKISGVRINGRDRWSDSLFARGCHGLEPGTREEPRFHWTRPSGSVWAPFDPPAETTRVSLRISAEREKPIRLASGERSLTAGATTSPSWHELELGGEPFDVVQNVGGVLIERGYGGDRGFQERDEGQFDDPSEVFGWCGCSVLLRRRYLEDVGLFDPRLFLYYEDFDLSWRGRSRGWRYASAPSSVVRHVHAASTVEHSSLFIYQVERSRLIVHLKNAPFGYAMRAVADSCRLTTRVGIRDMLKPALHGRRPYTGTVRLRLRAFGSAGRNLPGILADRRRLRHGQRVPDSEILEWVGRQ